MNTKQASRRFHIEEKEIRKRYSDGMIIDAYKDGKFIVVPDETEIIPSKQEIKVFLFQIIKHKNNGAHILSRGLCPNIRTLKVLLRYLYKRSLIGQYNEELSETELLSSVQLTDEGFSYILGEKTYAKLNHCFTLPITFNLGCVVL